MDVDEDHYTRINKAYTEADKRKFRQEDVSSVISKDTWPENVPIRKDSHSNQNHLISIKAIPFNSDLNLSMIANPSTPSRKLSASHLVRRMPEPPTLKK